MKDESFELLLGQEIREATTYYNFHNPIMFSNNFLKKRYVIGVESKNDWKLFMLMAGCIYSLPTENPISVVMKAGIKDIMDICKYRKQKDLSKGIENLQGLFFTIGTEARPIFDFMRIEGKQVYFRFDHSFSSNCQLDLKSNYTICESKVLNCSGSLGCLNLGLYLKSRSINNKGIVIRVPFNMMCLMFFGAGKSPKVMNGALKRDSTHKAIRDFFGVSFSLKSYKTVNGNYEVFLSRSKTKEELLEQEKKVEDKSKKMTLDEREMFLDQREGAFEKNKDTLAEAAYQRGRKESVSEIEHLGKLLKLRDKTIEAQEKDLEGYIKEADRVASVKGVQEQALSLEQKLDLYGIPTLSPEVEQELIRHNEMVDHLTGVGQEEVESKTAEEEIKNNILFGMSASEEEIEVLSPKGKVEEVKAFDIGSFMREQQAQRDYENSDDAPILKQAVEDARRESYQRNIAL